MECNSVKSLYNINVLSKFNFTETKKSLPADLAALGKASDRPKGHAAPLKKQDPRPSTGEAKPCSFEQALKESETSSD